jgi:hypothetical protein
MKMPKMFTIKEFNEQKLLPFNLWCLELDEPIHFVSYGYTYFYKTELGFITLYVN